MWSKYFKYCRNYQKGCKAAQKCGQNISSTVGITKKVAKLHRNVVKTALICTAILKKKNQKKIYIFASPPSKLVTNYVLEWMGLNLYDYDGLQPKMTHTKHSWGECIVHLTDVLTIFL